MRERNHRLAGAIVATMMGLFPSQRTLSTTSKAKPPPLVDLPPGLGRRLMGRQGPSINGHQECARRVRQMAAGTYTPNYR
jgi:hypothetical protein